MIEPDPVPVSASILFNLRSSLGNPRHNFGKYKKLLIQYSVNLAKYHDRFGLAGHLLPDATWLALNAGVPTPRPENIRPILPGGANALALSIKDYKMILADLALARDAIILKAYLNSSSKHLKILNSVLPWTLNSKLFKLLTLNSEQCT